jgi:hypothetical protein
VAKEWLGTGVNARPTSRALQARTAVATVAEARAHLRSGSARSNPRMCKGSLSEWALTWEQRTVH